MRTKAGAYRVIAAVCILLVFVAGFVAAVHFHADQSAASDRLCSVCALAHAGVVPAELGPQVPIFIPSAVSEPATATPGSLLLVSSHFIRPPPAV
jgi:hypothetical protein